MQPTGGRVGPSRTARRAIAAAAAVTMAVTVGVVALGGDDGGDGTQAGGARPRPLDGAGTNAAEPAWGRAGVPYRRVAEPHYADGVDAPADGPAPRAISNRVFDDRAQNIFSENGVTQWATAWAQFLDHSVGLRGIDDREEALRADAVPFDPADPLERFRNDFGAMQFARTPAVEGTGADTDAPRQQVNTLDSFLDASAVYGNSDERLEWLREGPVNGDLSDNGARLLLPDGQLPTAAARPGVEAPPTEVDGRLRATPESAVVAGDVRANENLALQAVQLLFAREHNRIVDALPADLSEQDKFDIARRVVAARQQYITYHEFLPSVGVELAPYEGFDPTVDPTISNEFATVGFRAHSMVHGELELIADAADVTPELRATAEAAGVTIVEENELGVDQVAFVVPVGLGSFNPDLLPRIGLGPVLRGLAAESQYRNDEAIDDQLRSVLFQVPTAGADVAACLDGAEMPDCFHGVVDLGALDVARGRDHGMPPYNELREAYGLAPRTSFAEVTGEPSAAFPDDPALDAAAPGDDPDALDIVEMRDLAGGVVRAGTPEADTDVVEVVRRTPLAARLDDLYGGDLDALDAFVGMVSEPHLPGSELGELQHAMWKDEFERLRDGDPFFYGNDPELEHIRRQYGIDFRGTLGQLIVANGDVARERLRPNVFRLLDTQALPVPPPRDASRTTPAPGAGL